jgi:predicted DNA-binding transcriptional regulator YafY
MLRSDSPIGRLAKRPRDRNEQVVAMEMTESKRERFTKRDRAARLTRVWTLLYQHRPHGITAHEIARRVNVNVRTAYRDIRAIEDEFGIAVSENRGRWLCEQGDFLPPLKLSLLEAVTLFLSARLMARFADKTDPHVVSAFGKLASVLPTPLAAHVHATVAAMQDGHLDRRYARVFETVATAWAESRKVRIAYSRQDPDGSPKVTRRMVSPRYLEPNPWGRGCYLIADDELSRQKRTFKLERITEAQLSNEHFEPAADLSAPSQLTRAWSVSDEEPTRVRLRFHDATAARRALENRWHPSQQEQILLDGTVELCFEVAGVLEITPWVLTWGDTVEVLEPPRLRERLATVAQGMARRYSEGATPH